MKTSESENVYSQIAKVISFYWRKDVHRTLDLETGHQLGLEKQNQLTNILW